MEFPPCSRLPSGLSLWTKSMMPAGEVGCITLSMRSRACSVHTSSLSTRSRRRPDQGVGRSSGPRSITKGAAILTSVCAQADLSRCLTWQVLRVSSRARYAATKAFKDALRSSGAPWLGVGRRVEVRKAVKSEVCRGPTRILLPLPDLIADANTKELRSVWRITSQPPVLPTHRSGRGRG